MARSTVFTASFDAADSTDIGADFGNSYTGSTHAQIFGNRVLTFVSGVQSRETLNSQSLANDQWAQVAITGIGGVSQIRNGILLRANSDTSLDTGVEFQAGANGAGWSARIAVREAGSITASSTESATTWSTTDTLRGEAQGSTYRLFRNDSELLSLVNTALSSGRVGIAIVTFTDPSTDCELDDFRCGEFIADAGTRRVATRRTLFGVGR